MSQAQILFVDDERSVLRSLNRALRTSDYTIHLADSGAEGLTVLAEHPIDIVVSDMRMPEMDGAAFLKAVADKYPETTRMLLTGYADTSSAIAAINDGRVARYLTKPWEDDDLRLCIQQSVETRAILKEKQRLEVLTKQQNHELKELNQNLEQKVQQRTKQIQAAKVKLEQSHKELRKSYGASIRVFSRLIQSRAAFCRRDDLAADIRALAEQLQLSASDCEQIYFAGLLCDIGMLPLSDDIVTTPYMDLSAPQQRRFQAHPIEAEAALLCLEPLQPAARILRSQSEHFDGQGFPDQLSGKDIPIGARLLAIARSYSDLQRGKIFEKKFTASEAKDYLRDEQDKRFDPELVDRFLAYIDNSQHHVQELSELEISPDQIQAGMIVSRDVIRSNGVLVLSKDQVLNSHLIEKLKSLMKTDDSLRTIFVLPPKSPNNESGG